MRRVTPALALLALLALSGWSSPGEEGHARLSAPFVVRCGDKAINVDTGHAAPLLADMDGDGKHDLLVGQFGGGKLLLYRNEGTNASPRFASRRVVQAGGKEMSVPYG
jgi:hypothetical protein